MNIGNHKLEIFCRKCGAPVHWGERRCSQCNRRIVSGLVVWFPFSIVPAILLNIIVFPLLLILGILEKGILGVFSAARTATPMMWDLMENSPYPRGARVKCNYGTHVSLPLFVPKRIWRDRQLCTAGPENEVSSGAMGIRLNVQEKENKATIERNTEHRRKS